MNFEVQVKSLSKEFSRFYLWKFQTKKMDLNKYQQLVL
jgi:hypothetical protein